MLPLCREEGIGVIPWSPLARGFVMGRSRTERTESSRAGSDQFAQALYYQDADYKVVDRITDVAKRHGVSNAQIALAWILRQPGITAPIIGASKLQHLDEAVKALEIKLTEEDLKSLAEPYVPHAISGHS